MYSAFARRGGPVVVERTVSELQGFYWTGIDNVPSPKRQIACTRSFGHGQPLITLHELTEMVSESAVPSDVRRPT